VVETTIGPAVALTRERRVSVARLFMIGCAAALLVLLGGAAIEMARLGTSDAAAAERLQAQVRAQFAGMTAQVESVARSVASDPTAVAAMASPEDDRAVRTLFDVAERAQDGTRGGDEVLAVTIYGPDGKARAWAGRASDLSADRTTAPASLFVTPTPLGLRLVFLQPMTAPAQAPLGSAAVEHVVTPAPAVSVLLTASEYEMPTSHGRVSLRLHDSTRSRTAPGQSSFTIDAPDGRPLLDASIDLASLAAERAWHRRAVGAIAVALIGLTVLLLAGPLLDARVAARAPRREMQLTFTIIAVIVIGTALLAVAFALSPWSAVPGNRKAFKLLLGGLSTAAIVATLVSAAVRLRVSLRARRRAPERSPALFAAMQLACGIFVAALLVLFERTLGRSVDPAAVDLRHFSLHPWTSARLATLTGILLGHAAVLWLCALACVVALARWRLPRRMSSMHALAAALWIAPIAVVTALAASRGWAVPIVAVVLAVVACAGAALVAPRLVTWYRRAMVASRILTLFVGFLVPALLVYPSVSFFGDRSMQRLVETRYAVEAMNHAQTLQDRLKEALAEIDALPGLQEVLADAVTLRSGPPRTDPAFPIWSQTTLARGRLTSDLEIYDARGTLVSRFALNFPQYGGGIDQTTEQVKSCRWETLGEALLFGGGQERQALHAQRTVCVNGTPVATLVVHVVFDFRALPFISSQSAYFEVLSQHGAATAFEGSPVEDVAISIFGWGLTSIYTSSDQDVWPLDDATFARVYKSREPFWMTMRRNGEQSRVYFANDRQFIYALGYSVPGVFDDLVRLAELTTLAAVGYVLLLLGNAVFTRIARARAQTGRALLREIRASFYRKLFLAFVLASIVPVLTLALVIRTYFAGLLVSDIQGEAMRTAAVAQRVIEESNALVRREGGTPFGDDDVLVWISQLINQDVNVFYDAALYATSERDLFASGLLPTRTPDEVYRAIVLQRLPSFVTQDQIGAIPYMLAAAPIRSGQAKAVLTVPLAYRQHEVEREIDDLDRGVHLAALFFILLGAGIGLSMAERIADPIRQLTRATGRIASGDFDARIAVRSSDELRRLVDAFNGMAAELKAQRDQLERTHRLEAWAEMARQVAHEIKNPLTPIQLSAEHLRRVHADRGEPLGDVLDGCVTSILGQVKLLRQISGEFSSFASSPTARRAPADPVRLVNDVVEPYRTGLAGRIDIHNDIAASLPAVLVDRTLVARALANIVENALHAMPGTGSLRIASQVNDADVVIELEDSGIGMDAEALARVFEPYFSTKTTGTGLGLPIARRNIELSGGAIEVDSEKGRGTRVRVTLPRVDAQ
jgi:signal transduction histidine kinase